MIMIDGRPKNYFVLRAKLDDPLDAVAVHGGGGSHFVCLWHLLHHHHHHRDQGLPHHLNTCRFVGPPLCTFLHVCWSEGGGERNYL